MPTYLPLMGGAFCARSFATARWMSSTVILQLLSRASRFFTSSVPEAVLFSAYMTFVPLCITFLTTVSSVAPA